MPHSLAEVVLRELTHYLGPHTAKSALKTFSERALGKTPDALTNADAPALLQALKPMLRTLLGAERCEEVLSTIAREVGP